MGVAFRVAVKAFCDNGQNSIEDYVGLPNIDAMVGTYRGFIDENHYLIIKKR